MNKQSQSDHIMTSLDKIKIYELTDKSRLAEVNRLTYNTYVEVGALAAGQSGDNFSPFPHLDNIPQTRVFVAEKNQEIIGTCSVTVDGPQGLPTDRQFLEETNAIRQETDTPVMAIWRLATKQEYRNSMTLFMMLMEKNVEFVRNQKSTKCLSILQQKHVRIYKKLFAFSPVVNKTFDIPNIQKIVSSVMMVGETKNMINCFEQLRSKKPLVSNAS